MSDIYFNSKKLPKPRREYIAFIDIMGTRAHMKNSVASTANYIFKLHAAILASWRNEKYENVFVYPVMDGAYITATSRKNIEKIIVRIYLELAKIITNEADSKHRFLIRGAIAYGETIHGHRVPFEASKVFETDLSYKNNILLGPAMIEAYEGESLAAPFGVYINPSAVKSEGSNGNHGSFQKDWKWFETELLKINPILLNRLKVAIDDYFNDVMDEQHPCHYPNKKIKEHLSSAKAYFG